MTSKHATGTTARLDAKRNRGLWIVSLVIAGGGITLLALGVHRDWGFLSLFWSGLLALLGVCWVVGMLKGGGAATAGCPHCGAPMRFVHLEAARTEQCERCGQWSAGTSAMAPLSPDHVATDAVFRARLPDGEVRWPADSGGAHRCPVCGQACTRTVEARAANALGSAFAALSPISVQRVHTLRVPACAAHDDGIALDLDTDGRGLVVLFRSLAYYRDFVDVNDPMSTRQPPDVTSLAEFLQHNPRPIELRAPLTCPKHDVPMLTTIGWVSRMELFPSHEWMDLSAPHPGCLPLGHSLTLPAKGTYERGRVAWCPACDADLQAAWAAR